MVFFLLVYGTTNIYLIFGCDSDCFFSSGVNQFDLLVEVEFCELLGMACLS